MSMGSHPPRGLVVVKAAKKGLRQHRTKSPESGPSLTWPEMEPGVVEVTIIIKGVTVSLATIPVYLAQPLVH